MTQSVPKTYEGLKALAEQSFKTSLRRQTAYKAVGPCPKCGGDDRFVVWLFEGQGTCMRCHYSKVFIEDEETRQRRSSEYRSQAAVREMELRASMEVCQDWKTYHQWLMDNELGYLFHEHGLTDEDILQLGLGYCSSCPVAPEFASLTFPVFYSGKLQDIRHRLIGDHEEVARAGRYRSHLPGLSPFPFNLDGLFLPGPRKILVEGEKKSLIVGRLVKSPSVVGIPGAKITERFMEALSDLAQQLRSERSALPPEIIVMLDPGQEEASLAIAKEAALLGFPASVVDSFSKPDDLGLVYGRTVLIEVMRQRRKVNR